MARAAAHAASEYLPATVAEIIGASRICDLPALDVVALTACFGPPIHGGDDRRYGPTWAAKDGNGNVWAICTRLGTWQLTGRAISYPSKPPAAATNRFAEYVVDQCKEGR